MRFIKLSIYAVTFVMAMVFMMLAFLLLPTPEEARLQSIEYKCKSLYDAEQLAMKDFDNGIYHIEFSGWHQTTRRQMILDSLLRAEFKIVPLYSGCIGTTDEVYRYLEVMGRRLKDRYGENFFEHIRDKQMVLWRKRTGQ